VKHRLIADCRELNQFCLPEKFTLENIQAIFPLLRKNWFAVKLDLKDAYFHLGLKENLKQFIRMQVGTQLWEFQAACFGISTLPKIFMSLMRVLQKLWRSKGLMAFVYLDDIILIGSSESLVKRQLQFMLETLCAAGFQINQKKSIFLPCQRLQHLGFIIDFQRGQLEVPPPRLKTIRKELGKVMVAQRLSCRKITSILGQIRCYLPALPFLRLVTQELLKFSQLNVEKGWDFLVNIPWALKQEIRDLKQFLQPDLGRPFLTKPMHFLHSDSSTWAWGGGGGQHRKCFHSRILEREKCFTYQRQGTYGCSGNHKGIRQTWRGGFPKCGQSGGFKLLKQVGGGKGISKQNSAATVQMVLDQQYSNSCSVGSIRKNVGRPLDQVEPRQGGLYPLPLTVPKNLGSLQKRHHPLSGHVCFPRKHTTKKFCVSVAPCSGPADRRPEVRLVGSGGGLRQPPLENNHGMVGQDVPQQKHKLSFGDSHVGFKCLVAPVNQNVQTRVQDVNNPTNRRNVQRLLGGLNAKAKMAPSLHCCFRFLLEQQQMSPGDVQAVLDQQTNLARYDRAFRKLYAILENKGLEPLQAAAGDIVSSLMHLNKLSPSEARNAFAAMSLLPGFHHLSFHPLLKHVKRSWNNTVQKYSTFWDPLPILKTLQRDKSLRDLSVIELRIRIILLFRLLALHRGIDLARTQRTLSRVQEKMFILLQRKGWRSPRWEQHFKI
jgi:hypothetical protein